MARGQNEVCMFCMSLPCECNKPAPKKKIESPKKVPTVVPFASPVQKRAGLATSKQIQDSGSDDKAFREALIVLARGGLMCADDMLKFEKVMNLDRVEFRTLHWKQRRAEIQWR